MPERGAARHSGDEVHLGRTGQTTAHGAIKFILSLKRKRPASVAGLRGWVIACAQSVSSAGTLPPFSASFFISALWSHMFMVAESFASPV